MSIKTVDDWLQIITEENPWSNQFFTKIYGERPNLIRKQIDRYRRLLKEFARIYSDGDSDREAEVVISRAPARVNLVGMHIDHQGGCVNPLASKEMTVIAQARDDDLIVMHNTNPLFSPRSFAIREELPSKKIEDWNRWTQQQSDARKLQGTAVDWSNYIKAAVVYIQDQQRSRSQDGSFPRRLKGMNLLVDGDIPMSAGLASSSALVVAVAEAIVELNGLFYNRGQFVELCAMAEWYIGTRGGAGDHAAIKLSRCGFISHICFFPLSVSYLPFPKDLRVVVCNSYVEAKKAAGAKSTFNERVASYEIALTLLKREFPFLKEKVKHFRDLCPSRLEVDQALLYKMLKTLPIRLTRTQLKHRLPDPDKAERLKELYKTHDEPEDGYRIRGVCLFGLAECERSEKAAQFLKSGMIEEFGRLMSLSHEGDRVSVIKDGKREKMENEVTDLVLDRLIENSQAEDPIKRDSAQLYRQYGSYAVSCKELDALVDIAKSVDGVLGAGRVGAGLGGCISVLVRADQTEALIESICKEYYEPRLLPPAVEVCFPVAGSSCIKTGVEG